MHRDDEDEDEFENEQDEVEDPPAERRPIADQRLYELALAAYADFPGQHAQVAAIISPAAKREVSGAVVRLWWLRGLPSLSLPPISEALKTATRAALAIPDAPPAVTLNPSTAKDRVKLRRVSTGALARSRETKALAGVERERLALERDKVRVELARAEADKARAEADAAKARAAASVAAGEVSEGASTLARMKADQMKIAGGIRQQTIFTMSIMNHMLQGLARLIPHVEKALGDEAVSIDADKGLKLIRRGVSTLKDFSEVAERNVKLDHLINGEPTEITKITVESDNPIETIMEAMKALQASAERGGIEMTAEQRALMEAIEIEQPEAEQ